MTGITYVVMPIMLRERCICSLLMWRADTALVSALRESVGLLCFTIRDKLTRRIVEFTCSESDILYTLLSLAGL